MLSTEFNLISRDFVLTMNRHLINYTAMQPVLISITVKYGKKFKVNQYEVFKDDKAHVINS